MRMSMRGENAMGLTEAQKKERSEYLEKNLEITECSQRKPYVFISYASDNWETVFKSAVVPMQKQYGLRTYADKAFDKVNDKWIVPMLRNVRGADVMIVFISQSYIESYACFLELLTAVNNKKQIVFVSLEEQLHLGDTTDQPNIERGVKNEILNQGANIATNTNNTSNDIMRAMKSAFTSISTLLEQDALSKYDISDAFINFFRDASINRKTINDLAAVKGTINSISTNVFDKSLIVKPGQPSEPKSAPVQQVAPEQQPVPQSVQQIAPEQQPVPQPARQIAPEQQSVPQSAQQVVSEQQSVPQSAPESNNAGGFSATLKKLMNKGSNFKKAVIAGGVGLLALIIIIAVFGNSTKNVENMAYDPEDAGAGIYTGEWKNGRPEGKGSIKWDNGDLYEGDWKDGKISGQGTYQWNDDGRVYIGGWVDYYCNGQGRMIYANGETYNGEWKDGLLNGQGTYTWSDGTTYTGEYKDGMRNGQGTLRFSSGETYTGEFKDDRYNGQGTYTWSDGRVFTGEWKDDKANGSGTMTYADGTVLTGTWQNGEYVEQ